MGEGRLLPQDGEASMFSVMAFMIMLASVVVLSLSGWVSWFGVVGVVVGIGLYIYGLARAEPR
jgi:hypothetical protein